MWLDIFITIFLVLLNGFFVAAEFAIVKVRSSQLDTRPGISKALANTTKGILQRLDHYLAATQLGITLASLGLGWIGEDVVAALLEQLFTGLHLNLSEHLAHQIALPVGFVVITMLHIVFGELAPKSLAIRYATSTSLLIAFPLKIFNTVFRPFIWLLNGIANMVLKLAGVKPAKEGETYSEEELKLIVSESHEGGAIDETERALIHNVFDFDNRRVKEILTYRKNIVAVDDRLSLQEAAALMLREDYSRYPVYEENLDQVTGIIFAKDVLRALYEVSEEDAGKKTLKDCVRKAYFIPENKKIKDLLREFQQQKQQMAIVVDEFGSVLGLVTMEDILEELVGEIQDEYDDEKPIVEKADKYTFLVDAQNAISDINKYLPYDLPNSDEYDTLSGLILNIHKNFPQKNQRIHAGDYEITILSTGEKSVEKVLLQVVADRRDPPGG
ncbi:hemolysin family protein [Compostibacter hankyongensis]|uniref:Hemolysin family protein n=1 Tax=Compostibacter hankyongensis TaxID=1007089 RepID=A0ABP8FIW4_9BACT